MIDTFIRSIGYYIPEARLTNEGVLRIFEDENKNRISEDELKAIIRGYKRKLEFLGSKSRSIHSDEEKDSIANMGINAAWDAVKKAGMQPEQIECIIFTGVCNPFKEPSFATVVARAMGLNTGDFFDINDTCNGFMKSIDLAQLYIRSGRYKNVMIATSENPWEVLRSMNSGLELEDVKDVDNRFSLLTLGAGAAAMILSSEGDGRIIKSYADSRESEHWDVSWVTQPYIPTPPTVYGKRVKGFWTEARGISNTILKKMPIFINEKLQEWGGNVESIDLFIMHQLGDNVTFGILKQMNVERSKAPINTYSEIGNLASANIPINLAIAEEKGILKSGNSVLLVGSGGGISLSLAKIEW